jgi:hypothetical protein
VFDNFTGSDDSIGIFCGILMRFNGNLFYIIFFFKFIMKCVQKCVFFSFHQNAHVFFLPCWHMIHTLLFFILHVWHLICRIRCCTILMYFFFIKSYLCSYYLLLIFTIAKTKDIFWIFSAVLCIIETFLGFYANLKSFQTFFVFLWLLGRK